MKLNFVLRCFQSGFSCIKVIYTIGIYTDDNLTRVSTGGQRRRQQQHLYQASRWLPWITELYVTVRWFNVEAKVVCLFPHTNSVKILARATKLPLMFQRPVSIRFSVVTKIICITMSFTQRVIFLSISFQLLWADCVCAKIHMWNVRVYAAYKLLHGWVNIVQLFDALLCLAFDWESSLALHLNNGKKFFYFMFAKWPNEWNLFHTLARQCIVWIMMYGRIDTESA